MTHKNIKVLCLVFGILLSGCAFTPSEQTSSVSSLSWSDPFDDPKITEQDLENNFCMVIENLRFLKGKEKNHAFAVRDGKITEHRSYAKKKPIVSSFETTIGKPLFDAMEIIGIPSFRGRYDIDSTLTYVLSSDSYVNVLISMNSEEQWCVNSYVVYDEAQFSEYFGKTYDYEKETQRTSYIPSHERIASIQYGTLFEDALFVLGLPQRGTYHGLISKGSSSGVWELPNMSMSLEIVTRWIEPDFPMFDSRYCSNGSSTYCGITYIRLY